MSRWQERISRLLPSGPLFSSLLPQVQFPSSSLESRLPKAAGDEATRWGQEVDTVAVDGGF